MSLARFDAFLQRRLPWLAPCSLVFGLVFGGWLAPCAPLVPWCFTVMTFSAGLSLRLTEFRVLLGRPGFLAVQIMLLHLVIPLAAWAVGNAVYADPAIVTGLIIIALTPAGTTSVVWVGIYKGNVALALAVLLTDTVAAPLLIPPMLKLLAGADVAMDTLGMMSTLAGMVLLPTLLAVTLNTLSRGAVQRRLGRSLGRASKLCIMGILAVNGGVASASLRGADWRLIGLVCFVFGLCCFGYLVAFCSGRVLFRRREDVLAFTICGGLRNVTAGATLALLYFPPLTSLTVVAGMLFQQILGCNAGRLADRLLKDAPAETLPA